MKLIFKDFLLIFGFVIAQHREVARCGGGGGGGGVLCLLDFAKFKVHSKNQLAMLNCI